MFRNKRIVLFALLASTVAIGAKDYRIREAVLKSVICKQIFVAIDNSATCVLPEGVSLANGVYSGVFIDNNVTAKLTIQNAKVIKNEHPNHTLKGILNGGFAVSGRSGT